ncbi:MAG: hypothetical protein ACRC0X_00650, partial [Brevinema sp.]
RVNDGSAEQNQDGEWDLIQLNDEEAHQSSHWNTEDERERRDAADDDYRQGGTRMRSNTEKTSTPNENWQGKREQEARPSALKETKRKMDQKKIKERLSRSRSVHTVCTQNDQDDLSTEEDSRSESSEDETQWVEIRGQVQLNADNGRCEPQQWKADMKEREAQLAEMRQWREVMTEESKRVLEDIKQKYNYAEKLTASQARLANRGIDMHRETLEATSGLLHDIGELQERSRSLIYAGDLEEDRDEVVGECCRQIKGMGRATKERQEEEPIRVSQRLLEKKQQVVTQYPLIVRGQEERYVPWTFMDVTGLISRLPNICDGAQKWITRFEEQTAGYQLAVGDVKAILSQTLGKARTVEILREVDRGIEAEDSREDARPLGPRRNALWNTLRKMYPTKADPGRVEQLKLEDGVSVTEFIQKLQNVWGEEMGSKWNASATTVTLFRMMLK